MPVAARLRQPRSDPSGRRQRAVGVGPARREEREERQPVAALVEVEIGDEHGGLVARRLHEHAPVGVADERGAVERQRRLGADAVTATMNVPLAMPLAMMTCSHSGSVSKSGWSGSEPIAVG